MKREIGNVEYLIPPWRHQLEAIERAVPRRDFALFFEMGAGKTGTAINILRHKFNAQKKIFKTLILCPPIVIRNWKDEWAKHSQLDPSKVVLLTGSGKRRRDTFLKATEGNIPIVAVTNYESLLMPDLYAALSSWGLEALILDESHKCKDPKSKRSKLVEALANPRHPKTKAPLPQPVKLILSGSPVLNSPMDLFMQFLILDGGETFGANFWAFRARYFRDKNAGMPKDRYFPKWEPMEGALEEMNSRVYSKGMRVEKKDCMDLPPLIRQTIHVGMTPEQEKMYKEMKRDLITFIEDKAVTATLAMTKALRLMQIASGYAKTFDGEEVSLESTPKMEALEELLSELTPHHKVIVWAVWKENYAQIREVCRRLGVNHVEVHGGTPASSRFKLVDLFNDDPSVRVFLGHPGAGGIGINLVSAPYSIFYSRTFSLEQSLQAEARNHRGGSEIHDKITRIDLVCASTIDELVMERLANKQEISDKILRDLVSELKNE